MTSHKYSATFLLFIALICGEGDQIATRPGADKRDGGAMAGPGLSVPFADVGYVHGDGPPRRAALDTGDSGLDNHVRPEYNNQATTQTARNAPTQWRAAALRDDVRVICIPLAPRVHSARHSVRKA